ncbi:MAG TPA: PIG-L deacetylase family protein [Gemmatimonadaceae bacterium]|nr:PIG-L deacetylase family protein [Gemmatimonadaceae bacterium]
MACLFLSFAHPDDESFFCAGVARKYADAGVKVVLCCATRGERGSAGTPPLASVDELPALREQELRAAAVAMGVAHLELLPYQDQQLADAPAAEVCESLVRLLRRFRPEIVITFGPHGGNRHTDHVAISRFTSDAVGAAADARWYPDAGAPHPTARLLWVNPASPWEATDRVALARTPGVDFLIDVGAWREAKASALAAHRTQHAGIDRLFLQRADRDAVLSTETFRLGCGAALRRVPADDLFAELDQPIR